MLYTFSSHRSTFSPSSSLSVLMLVCMVRTPCPRQPVHALIHTIQGDPGVGEAEGFVAPVVPIRKEHVPRDEADPLVLHGVPCKCGGVEAPHVVRPLSPDEKAPFRPVRPQSERGQPFFREVQHRVPTVSVLPAEALHMFFEIQRAHQMQDGPLHEQCRPQPVDSILKTKRNSVHSMMMMSGRVTESNSSLRNFYFFLL